MILIVSNEVDLSTNEVIRWLHFMKKNYIRINGTDKITITKINFEHLIPEILFKINNGPIFSTNEITSYWYRKYGFNYNEQCINSIKLTHKNNKKIIISALKDDLEICLSFLIHVLEKKRKIGSYYTSSNNKLKHLFLAKSLNLNIPPTLITTKKKDLNFCKTKELITKSISDGFAIYNKKKSFGIYTQLVNDELQKQIPNHFPPSLFQKNIKKKWEIRIFYFNGKFYSMAIFSQQDQRTKIDFRRYNGSNPNCYVPYKLPSSIETKLRKFMVKAELNTGSIDMIYSIDNKYYFLEVNPVGQFGMVSHNCNYYLEREIALYLQ